MEFIKVIEITELPVNQMKLVVVKGKDVLLANVEGTFYAIANKCTHLGGSLAKGVLEGGIVTCPRHGSRFDVKTGKNVSGPKIPLLRIKAKDEECYTVKIEGNDVLVGIP
jgi:3-phenylpropionate/trans-cinnamate dioxygenase ferredoxin subunit